MSDAQKLKFGEAMKATKLGLKHSNYFATLDKSPGHGRENMEKLIEHEKECKGCMVR